ncbi:unnamed protein product [Ixodes persulcatus]
MAEVRLPQKRYYRQRAHSNPIADHCFTYPPCPDDMDWEEYFPNFPDQSKQVEFADIGCGYGGLLVTLSPMFPDTYMVGMEIRVKVSDYVQDRIKALRVQHPGQYGNVACIRTNAMKHLPNFFRKGQVSKDNVYAGTLREGAPGTVCLRCVKRCSHRKKNHGGTCGTSAAAAIFSSASPFTRTRCGERDVGVSGQGFLLLTRLQTNLVVPTLATEAFNDKISLKAN